MNSKDTDNLAQNFDVVFAQKGDKITLADTRRFLKIQNYFHSATYFWFCHQ